MKNNKPRTLVLLFNDKNQVLLGRKKRGFGEGYWNGFWGKIEEGETIEQAALRELQEESGVVLSEKDLELRAKLTFNWLNETDNNYDGIVYIAKYNGEYEETEEMFPQWWNIDEIPYDKMWEDDKYRLPSLLEWKYIQFQANFSSQTELKDYELKTDDYLFFDMDYDL